MCKRFVLATILSVVMEMLLPVAGFAASIPAEHAKQQNMPRYFEENRGQWPAGQAFRAYGYAYGIALGKDGVTLQVKSAKAVMPQKGMPEAAGKVSPPREVSLRFEGASAAAQLTGMDKLEAKGAWFQGAEADWHSNIPLFERVRESQVYKGVDATFYGRDGQFEYDLDVAPGAKTGALVFDIAGADSASIAKNGDLIIAVDGQQMVLHKPTAWQPDGQGRNAVEVAYSLLPTDKEHGARIKLVLENYDTSKPLTIDPVLTFATYLSNSGSTLPDYYIIDLAIDSLNNVYVLSQDESAQSMTVQKLSAVGAMLYTATFSSASTSELYSSALRVNSAGQAYVAASVYSGYPTTSNAYQTTYPNHSYNGNNAALSVLSADGSQLVYSTYFGGTANGSYGSDYGNALAVDSSGNAYLAGQAGGGNFPTTTGAYQTTYTNGYPAAFVAKFNPSASGAASLVYSTLIGGHSTDVDSVAVDAAGDAYLSVYSSSCTAPTTAGAFIYNGIQTSNYCGSVTAVNPTGTALVYSAYLGPSVPSTIAVDGSHDVYVAGWGVGADDFPTTPGAWQTSYPVAFALELNPTGGLVYSTFLGGPSGTIKPGGSGGANDVAPYKIALSPGCLSACSAYISGWTDAPDFPVINGLSGPSPYVGQNNGEGFLVVLNGTGSAALTSGYLGGLNSVAYEGSIALDSLVGNVPHVAVDSNGNAWLAGENSNYQVSDFPVTTSAAPATLGAWLAEVSMTNAGNVIAVPNSLNFGTSIPVDVSSTAYDAANNIAPTTIALRNMGSAAVTLNSIVASPSYFTESDNCNGVIAAASYCTATVVFTPPTDAPVTGTLTITSNGLNNTQVVPLSGQGSDGNFIVASPLSLSFGNQTANTASAAQTVTLTNAGNLPVTGLDTVYFNNYNTSLNGFSGITDCPSSLLPGASCQVKVTFAPNENQIGLQSVALGGISYFGYAVALTGSGVLPVGSGNTQSVALSVTTLNFGTQVVGTASASQYEYMTNTGSQPLTFLSPTVTLTSSQGAAADFQVSGFNNCTGSAFTPQNYCSFYVTFTPSAAATETATLNIPVAGSSTVFTVSLIGQGAASTQILEFQPGNWIFTDQPVGTASSPETFYVYNTGNTLFFIDRVLASGDFSVYSNGCAGYPLPAVTAPGATATYCYVNVVFTPSQTGARSGTLTLIDAATGNPQTIPLTGNGITAAGVFSASPMELDFGSQVMGTSSAVQYVSLFNSGDANINFTAAATTGDYAITYNNCTIPYTLGPGSSYCEVGVTFTPTVSTSPDNGTLVLTTSAGVQTITLNGGGEAGTLASGLSPTSIAFGEVKVNGSSQLPVYVRNTGTEPITFSTAATITAPYSISDGCNTSYSGTLAPGQDCSITVYFSPTTTGSHNGTLTVQSNAGTLTASLTGLGMTTSSSPTYSNPAVVSFDQQAVNSVSGPNTVDFYYGGTASTYALTGASITAGSANFQLSTGSNAQNNCSSTVGSYQTSCSVNVSFAPTSAGYKTGTLTITSNAGSFTVPLTGYAPPANDSGYLSPNALSYPTQVVGTASPDYQQIYLYNTGAAAFTVGTLNGTNYGSTSEFWVDNGNTSYDRCSNQTLAPADSQSANGGSCWIYVNFTPSAAGNRTGTLNFPVTYSDGTTVTFTATLTGIGQAQKNEAVLSPTVATFPDSVVGQSYNGEYEQTITLTNSGNLPLTMGQLSGTNTIVGTSSSGDFTITSDNCSGRSVAAGNGCNIYANFQPVSAGARTGTVIFPVTYANASTPVNFTATLTGNGIAANPSVVIFPAGMQFDTVTVGMGISSNYQTVTINNTGNVPITINTSTLPTGFSFYYDYCTGRTVTPGSSCNEAVYFNPATAGTFTGSLSIADNATGSPQKVTLSGTSLAASAELQFSQSTVSFGNQLLNVNSNTVTLYLVNRGTDAVTINSIALSGTNSSDYSENDNCAGNNLAANSTCTITLTFTPSATGSRTATLTETDTGSGSGRTVSINGTGINATTAITFFPAALTFSAQQPVGTGSTQQFFSVVSNGANQVTITQVAATDAVNYTITQDGCTGATLSQGQSCQVGVIFTPTTAAAHSSTISITDNATGSPQLLPVSGTGIAAPATTVSLAATPESGAYGSLFTLTATVTPTTAAGHVTFYDGTTALGTVQVVTTSSAGGTVGTATLKTILTQLDSNSITAKYVGSDATSTSAAATVTVTGTYPTTTTFTSSGSAGNYTLTGTVFGAGPIDPTSNVTFTDTTTGLIPGSVALSSSTMAQTFVSVPDSTVYNQTVVGFADLNGDGIPDMVIGTDNNALLVQLGNGDGTFQAPQLISSASVSTTNGFLQSLGSSFVFGDFNGDGKADIAFIQCGNSDGGCSVGVLLGNGDGTFQKERYFDQTSTITGIAVGDFNGDGILDIAVANFGNGTVDLLMGNGDGTFQMPVSISMPGASSVAAADLTGNGKLDLVATNFGYGTVSVLLGNGNGTFQAAASYSTPVSSNPNNVSLASLRNNGKLDIVLQDYSYGVSVLLGNGDGTFGSAEAVYSPSSSSTLVSMAVADVNGDGKPDIVVADSGLVQVSVLRGNGDGTFQAPASYPTGAGPIEVAIADLNHDGRPDIAVANTYGNATGGGPVTVLLNHVTQTATLSNTTLPGTGTHSVTAAYSGDSNFASSTSSALQLAASLVTPTMHLSALPSASLAWGQALSVSVTFTSAYSFVPAPTGTVSYSIDGGAVQTATLASGAVTIPISQLSVGSHSIAVSYGGNSYYTTLAAKTLAVTIVKANQTITFNSLSSVTYGVTPITLSATASSGLPVTFTVTSGPASITSGVMTITGAGTVVIAANQAGNADYNAASTVSQSLTVAKATLNIAVNSATKVYGASLPTFSGTVTGLVNGDTVGTTLAITYSSTGTTSSPAGTYPITATVSGTAAANYTPNVTQGTLTVTKASLTVTANNASRPYNTANPTFTDTITGFVNGDTQSVVSGSASLTTTATLTSIVGTYPITAAQGTLAATNYTFSFVNGTLTVNQATPSITWTTPAAITYGTALSATQLNASSTVAGTFAYTPASGTVLTAGAHTLSVTLTPTDTTDYTAATTTVSLTVNQATPTITWAAPSAITYGTALSATQLNASSTVAGTFAYTPASGTVLTAGSHTLSVTLTPTDTTDYTTATTTVSLTVNQATPTITWAAPSTITYGTALSATQLNATSTVAGTFAYTPSAGTVLTAGSHTLSVTFTPTDTTDYTTATTTVSLTVTQATPSITWAAPAAITYGTALSATQLNASSTVAGSFAYTPVSGTVLTAGPHTLSVTLTPTDTTDYTTVTTTVSLTVNQATPAITWAAPSAITYGTALSATQLNASSTVAGSFAYTPALGAVLTAGPHTLSVTLTPTDTTDYTTATTTVSLTVNQVTPTITWATPSAITYGTALSATQLNASSTVAGTFAYTPAAGTVLTAGSHTLSVTFTPTDTTDYKSVTTTVSQTVNQVALTVTANNASRAYGAANPTFTDTITGFVNGDTQSVVSGSASLTTTAISNSPVGTYPITAALGTLAATNYSFSFVNGTLTVNQASPSITWAAPAAITYGTALSSTQLNASSTVAGTFAYTPALGTVLTAGPHTLSVTFTPTDTTDYSTATTTVSLTVNQATPTITWATPSAITYGTALSATQLNASSTVAGSFTYTPASGTLLTAGVHTLSVTLTPTDTTDYTTATTTVSLTVNQVTPTITWAAPSAINYGTALSATQLNATSTVAGTFAYTPATGTVLTAGSHTLSVTFTPTDTTDYKSVTTTVSLTVNQATLTVSANPVSRAYGVANPTFTNTITGFVNGDTQSVVSGSASLTATASATSPVGTYPITAALGTLAATNYSFTFVNGTLTVTQATPSVTWAAPAAITYGTALSATQLNASSTVAGSFTYTPALGTVLTAGPHTLSVTLTPTDTTDYKTATTTVSLTVNQATPTITWAAPTAITYGTALSATQLNASSSVAGSFVYTPASGAVLTAGAHTLSVTFTPTDTTDYTTATTTVSLTVNQVTPTITWAAPAAITYGTALSATQLNASSTVAGSFTYTPALGTVLTAGPHTLSVTLTPTDTTDYKTATTTVSLTVNQATPTITWAAPSAITYGTALSATQLNASSSVAGSFVYTPALGTVLTAGAHTLSVIFTPTYSTDYTTATKTVTLTVNKATLKVTANNASRAYGAPNPAFTDTISGFVNGDTQSVVTGAALLTSTATATSSAGTYPITAALGTLTASNYSFTFVNGTLTVTKATPSITWATPAAITYGTALSATQLNASSSVAGSFVYTPASGTVLTAGAHTLSVTFTPTTSTDYTTTTKTVTLTVNKAAQTITFTQPTSPVRYGVAPITLSASASSGLPVTFTVTGPATLSGAKLTITGAGTVVVKATQAGNSDYAAAATVGKEVVVDKASLTLHATNASVAYNQPIPKLTYTVTGFVNGDTASVLSGAPVETTTAKQGSAAGKYPITISAGSLSAANYGGFVMANGTLTITTLGTVATPTFSPVAGSYTSAQSVTIKDTTNGATIYYTTNGTTPTTGSTKYTTAINVPATETLKAIAVVPGYSNSAVASATYTINTATTAP